MACLVAQLKQGLAEGLLRYMHSSVPKSEYLDTWIISGGDTDEVG